NKDRLEAGDVTGDVKYHAEAEGTYVTPNGNQVSVTLLANPSHLEAVDPVVEGWTRAEQARRKGPEPHFDRIGSVPILIHGDAAFPAQGVVSEVLNLAKLEGYTTGGTLHIIANNQLGFTTDPEEGRSTRYASDVAKGFDLPIIHVNADDITACVSAVRLATAFRQKFGRDVVIDLIGYRRPRTAGEPPPDGREPRARHQNRRARRSARVAQSPADGGARALRSAPQASAPDGAAQDAAGRTRN